MEPNRTVQCCVNQDTMEQSTIICLWDISTFSLSIIQPVQHISRIYTHNQQSRLSLPDQSISIRQKITSQLIYTIIHISSQCKHAQHSITSSILEQSTQATGTIHSLLYHSYRHIPVSTLTLTVSTNLLQARSALRMPTTQSQHNMVKLSYTSLKQYPKDLTQSLKYPQEPSQEVPKPKSQQNLTVKICQNYYT